MKLILYHTLGCHLCELAEAILVQVQLNKKFEIIKIDIADGDKLVDLYGTSIPVVLLKNQSASLNWPFSAEDVLQLIS